MCRVLVYHYHPSPVKREFVFPQAITALISSWKDASHHDPFLKEPFEYFKQVNGTYEHSDGWGYALINSYIQENTSTLLSQEYYTDITPLKETPLQDLLRHVESPNLAKGNSIATIFHSRKASKNTPISLSQVHPMQVTAPGKQDQIYFIHNGGLNSSLFNNSLPTSIQLPEQRVHDASDTQFLAWRIMSELQNQPLDFSIPAFWKSLLQQIVIEHQSQEKFYSMILFILHKRGNHYMLLGTKAVLPSYLEHAKNYYGLFLAKAPEITAFMSSTAYMYLQEKPEISHFEIQEIPNHSFFAITETGDVNITDLLK